MSSTMLVSVPSVFVSTDAEMIEYAAKAGADRVELYTEPYATAYPKGREAAVAPFCRGCQRWPAA